jgi:protocatechuate 3,4-dioxygenase beta subunit
LIALAAARAMAAPIAVHGRVEAEGGGSLRDAMVRLYPLVGIRGAGELQLAGKLPSPHKAEAKVDAEGGFRIEAPGPGVWRLVASAPGRAPLETIVPLVEETWLPSAELPGDAPLEVTVVDSTGKPASGAAVVGEPAGMRRPTQWMPVSVRALTDAQGKATVQRGVKVRTDLAIAAPGHVLVESKGVGGSGGRIALAKGEAREIAVVGPDGRPVAGALVMVPPSYAPIATTGPAGRAALTAAPGKPLRLWVEDDRGGTAGLTLEPPAKGETPRPLRVQLARAPALAGRVIDRETRAPLAAALVWNAPRWESWTLTDGAGAYVLGAFSVKASRFLTAAAAGHLRATADVAPAVAASGRAPTLALPMAGVLAGSVVDARGRPLAGVEVVVNPAPWRGARMFFTRNMAMGLQPAETRSDARGQFRVAALQQGSQYEVTFRKQGFATLVEPAPPPRDRIAELHVTMALGGRGVGKVVTTAGAPIEGAKVTLERQTEDGAPGPARRFGWREERAFEATTDRAGKFSFADLPAGRFQLQAEAAGHATTTVPGIELPATAGEVDLGTVKLPPGAVVEGRVVGPRGEPIEGAEVFVLEGMAAMMPQLRFALDGQEPKATTAADGFFRIGELPAGNKVDVAARRSGYTPARAGGVVAPTAEPVTLTLRAASAVRGRVVDEDGEPIADANVRLNVERAGGGFAFAMTGGTARSGDDGRFTVEDVEPGTMRVTANAPGFLPLDRGGVEVPAGKDLEGLELVLRAGAAVEGVVTTPEGVPAAGATVRVLEEGGAGPPMRMMSGAGAETDGDGRYRLDGVETGRRTLQAEHQGFERAVAELEVRSGDNQLDLRLGGGQEVSGRVVGPAGQPVGAATVTLAAPGERWSSDRSATTDASGAFTLAGVTDGTYELAASHADYGDGRAAAPVQVAGAPVAGLVVELPAGAVVSGRLRGLSLAELSRVWVSAFSESSGGKRGTVSFDGRYRIAGLGPGEWQVTARLDVGGKQARGRVTLAAGEGEGTLDLEFEGGTSLSGVVRQGGRGVDGAMVLARGDDVAGGGTTRSDHAGRYRLENLRPGAYRVEAYDPRSGLRDKASTTVDEAGSTLDFDLRGSRLAGRVLEAGTGDPIGGARVHAEEADADGSERVAFQSAVTSDDTGRFVLAISGAGSWRLAADKEGYAQGTATVTAAGEPLEGVEIRLQPTQGVTLQVSRAAGAPPAEVNVSLLHGNGTALSTGIYPTGENGRVRLSTVPPGTWEVLVRADGTGTERVVVTSPGPAASVVLAPQATLTVVVPELAGEAIRADVTLTSGDGRRFMSPGWGSLMDEFGLAYGRTTIRYLPAGTWTVRASTRDGRRWEATATTTPGSATTVELR